MFFRRAREERAKLKKEKRELEELKKEIQTLQNNPQKEGPTSKPENVKGVEVFDQEGFLSSFNIDMMGKIREEFLMSNTL